MPQILRIGPYSIEANSSDIIDEWSKRFGEIRYFC